jgi:hypothetical protein
MTVITLADFERQTFGGGGGGGNRRSNFGGHLILIRFVFLFHCIKIYALKSFQFSVP